MKKRLLSVIAILLSGTMLFGFRVTANAAGVSGQLLASNQAFLDEINAERVAAGLTPMTWNMDLEDAAAVRAYELPRRLSHKRPNGTWWYTVNDRVVYGENLCRVTDYNNVPSADYVTELWMNSPSHKAILMDPSITTVGVCVYTKGDGRYYFAAEFGFPV